MRYEVWEAVYVEGLNFGILRFVKNFQQLLNTFSGTSI